MSVEMIVLLSFVASGAYIYVGNRLNSMMQPMRLELIDKAEHLLKYSDLRESDRNGIIGVLDRVYSYRSAWVLVSGVLVMSLVQGVKNLFGRREIKKPSPHKREITDFIRVAFPCILANSLAATLVFFIVGTVGVLLMLPVRSAVRLVILMGGNDDHGVNNNAGHTHC